MTAHQEIEIRAAKAAMLMQSERNLRAVVQAMVAVADDLEKRAGKDLATHPAMKLFASRIHGLTGMGLSNSSEFGKAYTACAELLLAHGQELPK